MENNEIKVNEEMEETKATKRPSAFKAFMIGGVLTLAGIAGFKKVKSIFDKKKQSKVEAEADFIDNVDYVEVDSENSEE